MRHRPPNRVLTLPRKAQQTEFIKLYEEEIMAHDLYVALGKMFDQLLAAGRQSPAAACKVDVGFEKLDIAELRAAQKSIPAAKDTLLQLEWASGNHLRAFHRNLTARGATYKATHLKKKDLKSILAGNGPEGAAGCGEGCAPGGCKAGCDKPSGQNAQGSQGRGQGKGARRGQGKGQGRGQGPGRKR